MRETLQALVDHAQHRFARAVAAGRAGAVAMRALASLGLVPFAPYHWLLYSESLYFDVDQGAHRARLGAAALERVDGDRVVRVVPRAPATTPTARAASHHQSPVRPGLLRALKALP